MTQENDQIDKTKLNQETEQKLKTGWFSFLGMSLQYISYRNSIAITHSSGLVSGAAKSVSIGADKGVRVLGWTSLFKVYSGIDFRRLSAIKEIIIRTLSPESTVVGKVTTLNAPFALSALFISLVMCIAISIINESLNKEAKKNETVKHAKLAGNVAMTLFLAGSMLAISPMVGLVAISSMLGFESAKIMSDIYECTQTSAVLKKTKEEASKILLPALIFVMFFGLGTAPPLAFLFETAVMACMIRSLATNIGFISETAQEKLKENKKKESEKEVVIEPTTEQDGKPQPQLQPQPQTQL